MLRNVFLYALASVSITYLFCSESASIEDISNISDLNSQLERKLIEQLNSTNRADFSIQERGRNWKHISRVTLVDQKTYGKIFQGDENKSYPGEMRFTVWGRKCIRAIEKAAKENTIGDLDVLLSGDDGVFPTCNIDSTIILTASRKKDDNRKNIILIPPFAFNSFKKYEQRYNDCVSVYKNRQSDGVTFRQKTKKAFWRGTHMQPFGWGWESKECSDRKIKFSRTKAIMMSNNFRDFLDCKYVKLDEPTDTKDPHFSYRDMLYKRGFGNYASLTDQAKFAYHLCIDGWAGSWELGGRLTEGMLLGNLCFNASVFDMYFENLLEPFVHFIPVKSDLSDLIEQVKWANEHPVEAEQIAEAGHQFAIKLLHPENVLNYFIFALKEISKKQQSLAISATYPRLNFSASIPFWKQSVPLIDNDIQEKLKTKLSFFGISDSETIIFLPLSVDIIQSTIGQKLSYGTLQRDTSFGVLVLDQVTGPYTDGTISTYNDDNEKTWFIDETNLFICNDSGNPTAVYTHYVSIPNSESFIMLGYHVTEIGTIFPYLYKK
ncbi:MAG: glycosyl transferase family 90 [Candidatus Paracaedibacteraceae bacterium]|nr:glycosyl transferase family 90 [Candidatus Paracaedibacteraceae bacterium]